MRPNKGFGRIITVLLVVQLLMSSVWAMPGQMESGYGSAANECTAAAQKTYQDFQTRALNAGETLHKGVDVAYYQGHPDWQKVKNSGVDFAFIRVGYRTWGTNKLYEDVYWEQDVREALAAGLQVGVYVFSQATTTEEAEEDAKFLLDRISGFHITLPLVMDVEYACNDQGELTGHLYDAHLTREELTIVCKAFCDTVEAANYTPAIYASKNLLQYQLYAGAFDTIWMAHYTTATDYTGDYDFWQCSGYGLVDGIDTATDLDFWYDDGTDYSGTSVPQTDSTAPAGTETGKTLPFWDVSTDSWSYSSIQYCYERGIITGKSDYIFDPGSYTTRGQVVTMLYRAAGSPAVSGSSGFTDLTADYYRNAITWARARGIVNGNTETTFGPDNYITRQDFVTILYRYAGKPAAANASVLQGYADSWSIDGYAWNAMAWAVENGIMKGADGCLDPHGYATREQIAALIMRFEKLSA